MSAVRAMGQQAYRRLRFGLNDWLDRRWNRNPLTDAPAGAAEEYLALAAGAAAMEYPELERFERETGFALDRDWHDELVLQTLIVKKARTPRPFHGRLIYTLVRRYIAEHDSEFVTIVETGTARGCSALCMAKALEDASVPGHVLTIDRLPHLTPIFWNCIADCDGRKRSRRELLARWDDLCRRITFIQGDTLDQLGKIGVSRVNFAFLDAQHTRADVLHEFRRIAPLQQAGDIVLFDDVDASLFPGVVAAVDEIEANAPYEIHRFDESGHGMAWATHHAGRRDEKSHELNISKARWISPVRAEEAGVQRHAARGALR